MRYFIHLGYDGSRYKGWQRQKSTKETIQEVIENTFLKLLKRQVTVYGCGRTDTGVHASQYIMHVDLEEDEAPQIQFLLNKNLPDVIAVYDVLAVASNQHCRYDASTRTYDYFLHWKKDPALFRYSSFYPHSDLNVELMREAAQLILQTKDFKPLCKQADLYQSTLCEITKSELFVNEAQGRLRFSITSNRFLRSMVRYCVFFLLEVGQEKLTLNDFEDILKQKKIEFKKRPALPNGLFLSKVEYPYLTLNNSSNLMEMLKLGLS